jgi:hypothetical protein
MFVGFTRTDAPFDALGTLLGVFEGLLYAGSLMVLSMAYTEEELALRVGWCVWRCACPGVSSIGMITVVYGSWCWVKKEMRSATTGSTV